jgi:chromosome segregation ATPase
MTVSNDQFDTLRRLVEQLGQAHVQSRSQHDQEMLELRQLQTSNAQSIAALTNQVATVSSQHDQEMSELRQLQASNAQSIAALTNQVMTTRSQHDQEMSELRQLQTSNARAIEALTDRVSQVSSQVAGLSSGIDASFRTIESLHRVMESLEISQIEARQQQQIAQQQHQAQMTRLGQTLDLLVTRYPQAD